MTKALQSVAADLSSHCVRFTDALRHDQMDRAQSAPFWQAPPTRTLKEWGALTSHIWFAGKQGVKEDIFRLAAAIVDQHGFGFKADLAKLDAFDSKLSILRSRYAPQDIADHAPVGMWEPRLVDAARYLVLPHLTELLETTKPTGTRVPLEITLNLPNSYAARLTLLNLDMGLPSVSDVALTSIDCLEQFLDRLDSGDRFQSRRADGSIREINRGTLIDKTMWNENRTPFVFSTYSHMPEHLEHLRQRARVTSVSDVFVRAAQLCEVIMEEKRVRHSLENLSSQGDVTPAGLLATPSKRQAPWAPSGPTAG